MIGRHTISDVTALSDAVDILAERFDNLDIMLTEQKGVLVALGATAARIEKLQEEATQRHVDEMVEDSGMSKPYFDHQAKRLRAHWWESFKMALATKTLSLIGYGVLAGLLLMAGYMAAHK